LQDERKERRWENVRFCVEIASVKRLEILIVDDSDEYCEPLR